MHWHGKIAALAVLASTGCVTSSGNQGGAERRASLAVLPVESDTWPALAEALNRALGAVQIKSDDEVRRLKVAIQVVQLQIECLETTDACFTAAGKSLNANRLLTAKLGKDKSGKGVRVTLVLFDVDRGTPIRVVDRAFKKQDEAAKGVEALVAEVVQPP